MNKEKEDKKKLDPTAEPFQVQPGESRYAAAQRAPIPELQDFDVNDVKADYTCTFLGRRGSGKTTAVTYILCCIKNVYPFGIVITDTRNNGYWQLYAPERYVKDQKYGNAVLHYLFKAQIKRKDEFAKKPFNGFNPYIFVVLDDVVTDDKFIRYNPAINRSFMEGRHFDMTVFVTTQHHHKLSPAVRANTDLYFIFHQDSILNKESLYEEFGSGFINKDHFIKFLDHYTQGYKILVVNRRVQTDEITEKFFTFEHGMKKIPPFRLGSDRYWKRDDWEKQVKKYTRLRSIAQGFLDYQESHKIDPKKELKQKKARPIGINVKETEDKWNEETDLIMSKTMD